MNTRLQARLLACLIFYIFVEVICLVFLYVLAEWKGMRYNPVYVDSISATTRQSLIHVVNNDYPQEAVVAYDSLLGWTVRPNLQSADIQTNSQSIRSNKSYAAVKPQGKTRIVTIGDSFTFGDEVSNESTFQYHLEAMHPALEVLNYGVPAYGIDQAYLRYVSKAIGMQADIVLFGFINDDVLRCVNVYRGFNIYDSPEALTKPYFKLEGDELVLNDNPMHEAEMYREFLANPEPFLREWGEDDFNVQVRPHASALDISPAVRFGKLTLEWLRKRLDPTLSPDPVGHQGVNMQATATKISLAIFEQFYAQTLAEGSKPVFVYFPHQQDFERYNPQDDYNNPFIDEMRRRGWDVIDVLYELKNTTSYTASELYRPMGHFNHKGHVLIAKIIDDYLLAKGPMGVVE